MAALAQDQGSVESSCRHVVGEVEIDETYIGAARKRTSMPTRSLRPDGVLSANRLFFDDIGISHDDFRRMDLRDQMKCIVEHFKQRLRPGERVW